MEHIVDLMAACGAFTIPVATGILLNLYTHQISNGFFKDDVGLAVAIIDKKEKEETPVVSFIDDCILSPLLEEGFFRLLLIGVSLYIWGPGWQTWAVAIASCVLFGLIHLHYGIRISLLCMGFGSFALVLLFLAYAEIYGIWTGYAAVVVAHAVINAWNWVDDIVWAARIHRAALAFQHCTIWVHAAI